jgi:hypothetical protein
MSCLGTVDRNTLRLKGQAAARDGAGDGAGEQTDLSVGLDLYQHLQGVHIELHFGIHLLSLSQIKTFCGQ